MPDLSVVIDPLIRALQKNTDTYAKFAEELRAETATGARGKRESVVREKYKEAQQVKKSAESFKKLHDTLEDAIAATKVGHKVSKEQAKAIRDAAEETENYTEQLSDTQKAMVKNATKWGTKIAVTQEAIEDLGEATSDILAVQSNLVSAKQEELAHTHAFGRAMDTGFDRMKAFYDRVTSIEGALAQLGTGLKLTSKMFNENVQHQQYSFSLLNTNIDMLSESAALAGMSAGVMDEVFSQHRQTILATSRGYEDQRGAMLQWRGTVGDMMAEVQEYTNDADLAARLIMDSASTFTKQAVALTHKEIEGGLMDYINTLKDVTKLTGVQGTEINKQIRGYLETESARQTMLQMNEKERRGYALRLAREAVYYTEQGKTVDQFIQAQSTLAGLSGMDPRQQLKEASRLMGVAGAMGMEIPNDMLRIMTLPTALRSEEDEIALQKFATDFTKTAQAKLGTEGGERYAIGGLLSASQGPMLDMLTQLSTAASKGTRLDKQQADAATDGTEVFGKIGDGLNDFFQWIDRTISPFFHDPSGLIFTGVASALAAVFKMIGFAAFIKYFLAGGTSFIGGLGAGFAAMAAPLALIMGPIIAAGIGAAIGKIVGDMIYDLLPEWAQNNIGRSVAGIVGYESDGGKADREKLDAQIAQIAQRQQTAFVESLSPEDKLSLYRKQKEYMEQQMELADAQLAAIKDLKAELAATRKAVNAQGDAAQEAATQAEDGNQKLIGVAGTTETPVPATSGLQ